MTAGRKSVLWYLRRALGEGATVRDGAEVLSWKDGRFAIAHDESPPVAIHDEEARERLGWLVLHDYEAITGVLRPVAETNGAWFDSAIARRSLEEHEPALVARFALPMSPGAAIFDAFADGYRWERGDKESFEDVRFRDGRVVFVDGDPLSSPPTILSSEAYDRAAFSARIDPTFDLTRSQPATADPRAAEWLRAAQRRLRFPTLRLYQGGDAAAKRPR